ncbi:unnamed protein product [Closterium sp. NIES-65]|nr:unnamed protein product [Closterium sp. NIES-65]
MASSSDSSVDLATVDALELLPDNSAANWHSYAHSVEVLLSSVVVSGYNLRSVVFQEGGGLQPAAPTAPTGPAPAHPGAEPSPPGDPPAFAPNVNDPQSSETAIRTYRTNLQEHLRLQLRYEDDRRIYDDAAARYNKYQEDLDTYTAELADYTTKITAWRVADRRVTCACHSSRHHPLLPQTRALTYLLLPPVATAAAFTRRVLDLSRRLAALDVVYPDTVICCHLLEGLTPAFDAHKLAYMQLISKHHTPAEVAQWIITTEAEILRHSSSTAAAAQSRSNRGGRGGTALRPNYPCH